MKAAILGRGATWKGSYGDFMVKDNNPRLNQAPDKGPGSCTHDDSWESSLVV